MSMPEYVVCGRGLTGGIVPVKLAAVSRRLFLVYYVILALVFLRCAGLHVHVHNHLTPLDNMKLEVVQLAKIDNHGDTHSQDIDIDVLDATLTKYFDNFLDDIVLLALLALAVLSLGGAGQIIPLPPALAARSIFRSLRPPSRAPPRLIFKS